MADSGQLHLVTGLPCAGKTTLCQALASALDGTAISTGALIRAARSASRHDSVATQNAFEGRAEYPARWLAGLLEPQLRDARGPVLLDGAAPLPEALALLGIKATSVLELEAGDQARRARLARRREGGSRTDDSQAVFDSRSRFHRASIGRLRSLVPSERYFVLDAGSSPQAVLRQALSAVAMASAASRRPGPKWCDWPGREDLGGWLSEKQARAADVPLGARADGPAPVSPRANQPVLLFKPGHAIDAELTGAVMRKFAEAGYSPVTVVIWPGRVIAASGLASAHLELHYLLARWADVLLPAREPLRPAYQLIRSGRTHHDLDSWWHSEPFPVKLGRCTWAKRDQDGTVVVNGHIPAMVDRWEQAGTSCAAIRLAAEPGAVSWRELRDDVLGGSHPASAGPGSLRRMAFLGELPVREPVTQSANLLHLSAGPAEAGREQWLWQCGPQGAEVTGRDLIDVLAPGATSGRTWKFEATENLEAEAL